MARKKSKRKNRRKQKPLIKGGLVLLAGILIGLFTALLIFLNHQQPATAPAIATAPVAKPRPVVSEKPEKVEEVASKYIFYGSLPTSEVVVPESNRSAPSKTIIIQDEKEFSGNYSSYLIQVGSFQKAAGADDQKARLAFLGYETNIEKTRLHDGNIVHRVLLGPFADLESVNQLRTKLHSQKIESTLLKSE